MSQRTPGPWTVNRFPKGPRGGGGGLIITSRANVNPIVHMPEGERNEANARLIAAAPDLLAALLWAEPHIGDEYARSWPDDPEFAAGLGRVRAAILKATAVPEPEARQPE